MELEFLIKTVKAAAELITDDFEVKAKDDNGDLVTNFDYEVEKFITDRIKEEYPDFAIVSEEFNCDKELTDNCFTIDPIDGTINFAHGLPLWAIQVACIKDGKTCAAVIYLPKLNELYCADETGAYLNGNPIKVNNMTAEKGLYCIEGPGNTLGEVKMRTLNKNYRDLHCTAVNFAFVASGRFSATNFVWDTVWDYIPGEFIVEKAGGCIYNAPKMHIAANSKEFLELLLNNSSIDNDKKVVIVDK